MGSWPKLPRSSGTTRSNSNTTFPSVTFSLWLWVLLPCRPMLSVWKGADSSSPCAPLWYSTCQKVDKIFPLQVQLLSNKCTITVIWSQWMICFFNLEAFVVCSILKPSAGRSQWLPIVLRLVPVFPLRVELHAVRPSKVCKRLPSTQCSLSRRAKTFGTTLNNGIVNLLERRPTTHAHLPHTNTNPRAYVVCRRTMRIWRVSFTQFSSLWPTVPAGA